MENAAETLKTLERKFWKSLANQEVETALELIEEPALMINAQGSRKFDRATYRKMLKSGDMVLKSFELGDIDVLLPSESTAILSYDVKQVVTQRGQTGNGEQRMHDTSTWVRTGNQWKCVAHTETPAGRIQNA